MSTTTLRIEDELKARVAAAAQHMGKSAHAFMVEALAQRVEQVEQDAAFHALAEERWGRLRATGQTVGWEEAKAYLSQRAQGMPVAKPSPRSALG